MKIALVNPNSELSEKGTLYSKLMPNTPPLGIAYIAAVLQQNNFNVEIFDHHATKERISEFASKLHKSQFTIIGFSCLTPAFPATEKIILELKRLGSKALLVMGSFHGTIFDKEITESGLVAMAVLVTFYFMVTGYDFFNDFGYWIGRIIFGG